MHQNFASRLLALNDSEAASLLLRCGTTSSSGEYGDHLYAEDASFSREQPTTTSVAVPRRGSFTSAENMSVPDNAPGSDSSSVYRFVLQAAQATALNAALRHDAIEQSQSSRGIQVSNAGGFHGKTTTLDPKASDAWYGPLRKVIVEVANRTHRTLPQPVTEQTARNARIAYRRYTLCMSTASWPAVASSSSTLPVGSTSRFAVASTSRTTTERSR